MGKSLHSPPTFNTFQTAWAALANNPFLLGGLLIVGSATSVVAAHPPLVALAAMGGLMLQRHRAIAAIFLIWLVNQGIGFGLRGYPLTPTAFDWGLLMGLGALAVVVFASWRPTLGRTPWLGHWLWMAIAVLVGFGLYQGLILLAFPILANGHLMDWPVVGQLLQKELLWAGAIGLGYNFWLWRQLTMQRLSQSHIHPS